MTLKDLSRITDVLIKKDFTTLKTETPKSKTSLTVENSEEKEIQYLEVNGSYIVAEQFAYEVLSFLSFLLGVPVVGTCCNSLQVATMLLKLLGRTTPRIQRVCCRIFRRILRYHEPYMLGKWSIENEKEKK